mmetsp:Transcript_88151/g.107956  ORF Transcript_88151/g.107956 Transcript_88151/m.107956 type:complete len:242 (-) Transcript_88151:110-835(-)
MSISMTSEVNKGNHLNEALLDEKEHDIRIDGDIAKPAIQPTIQPVLQRNKQSNKFVPKKCQNCDNLLPKNARFCVECGHSVINHKACKTCSTKNRLTNKFCLSCGHSFTMNVGESLTSTANTPTYGSTANITQNPSNNITNNVNNNVNVKLNEYVCCIRNCPRPAHYVCKKCKRDYCGRHAGYIDSKLGTGVYAMATKVQGIFCDNCKRKEKENQWGKCCIVLIIGVIISGVIVGITASSS